MGVALTLAVVVVICAATAGGALAATQLGSGCTATNLTTGGGIAPTILQVNRVSGALIAAPSAGVVTGWSVTTETGISERAEKLKVFKPLGGGEYETAGESAMETVLPGRTNEFKTRIPIAAGVMFGVNAPSGVPFCDGASEDVFAYFAADTPPGGKSSPAGLNPNSIVALSVTVEPDADHDGYGDETQDKCPQSAALQSCPPAAVQITRTRLEGNTVAVFLATSFDASATVTGAIKGTQVSGPVTAALHPGQVGRAYLQLPQSVLKALAKLPRKRHLNLVVEVGVQSIGGNSSLSAEIALPGRKKHRRHYHHHHHRRS